MKAHVVYNDLGIPSTAPDRGEHTLPAFWPDDPLRVAPITQRVLRSRLFV